MLAEIEYLQRPESVEQDSPGVLAPWEESPYQLLSWWAMLQFSAYMLFFCGGALRQIKADCLLASMVIPGDQPIFNMAADLDQQAKDNAIKALNRVEPEYRKVGMRITA